MEKEEQMEKPFFCSYDMLPAVDPEVVEFGRVRVAELREVKFAPQGSQEWLDERYKMLTASDWGAILGESKYETPEGILYKKCGKTDKFTGNRYTQWGHKYEDVAIQIYNLRNRTVVREFGLIRHDKHSFLGASPDGITDDGIMVEIKCPSRREITGEIPRHYWCQIQAQLEVCKLEWADFLECKIEEYDDEIAYHADTDGSDLYTSEGLEKGVVACHWDDKSKKETYRYCPLGTSIEDIKFWEKEQNPETFRRLTYWALRKISCVRVQRDREWFASALPRLRKFWEDVEDHREKDDLESRKTDIKSIFGLK